MASLRPLAVLLLLSAPTATTAAAEPATDKKRPVVQEQRPFDVPLDFKNRSDFNIGDPASIPSGRMENLSVEPKYPFFGLGVTRPFGGTK